MKTVQHVGRILSKEDLNAEPVVYKMPRLMYNELLADEKIQTPANVLKYVNATFGLKGTVSVVIPI